MSTRPPEELPLLLTKIQPPHRQPRVLRRARLIEKLHQNLHRKLTFITAPAGFGKTTLLVDFVSEAPAKMVWYHITAEDRDLRRFVRYVVGALAQRFPHLQRVLEGVLEGGLPAQHPVMLAAWLNNLLAEYVDDFTLVVLDDYHLVGEQLEIVDFVEAWLEYLPEQVRLLVASRSVYGIPTTRLYLRGELGLLGPDDLRFTAEELQALAQLTYGVNLPGDYAADLARRTDGWIIAMLLAIRLRTEGRLPLIRGEREELYAFLAEEVLHHLPAHLVAFLLKSSIFEEFDVPLCREVLEEPESAAYLQEIEERNLFVTRVDAADGVVYRYHQLFGDFLRARLQAESPGAFAKWHRRAAEWYWARGAVERAIAHRLAAGDREGAAHWMDEAAREVLIRGQIELLAQWVETLEKPPDLRAQAPRLLLYYAKALSGQRRFQESDAVLVVAHNPLLVHKDALFLANLFETQGYNAFMQGEYSRAVRLVHRAIEHLRGLESKGVHEELKQRLAQARRIKALATFYLGERQKAIAELEEVAAWLSEGENKEQEMFKEQAYNLALVFQDLGIFYFQEGRLSDALRAFVRARRLWQRYRLNPVELPSLLNNLAFLYRRMGQEEKALEVYLEAADIARKQPSQNLTAILGGIGEIYYERGEWDKAQQAFEEALQTAQQGQAVAFLAAVHRGMALLQAARGRFADALGHLRQAAVLLEHSEDEPWYRWRKAQLYWLLGEEAAALNILRTFDDEEVAALSLEERARLALVTAALLQREGEKPESAQWLQQALGLVARLGYVHFLKVEARRLWPFLQEVQRGSPHPVLEELLRLGKPEKQPVVTSVREEKWLPLRAQAFGGGEVWRGDERIPRAAWRAAGARALFFFILDRGGVRKEEITLAFWPDFSPAQVNSNLHATLWRVRRALGDKSFIVVQEGRYFLHPELKVEYDVARFESFLREAARAQGREQQVALLAQAAQTYQGDFLEGLDFPWVDERRYELQRRYRETLEVLIQDAMAREDFVQAAEWLEPALALDPFNDVWHLYKMRCLQARGATASAKAYYRAYRRRLQKEMGLEPAPELRRFAEQL